MVGRCSVTTRILIGSTRTAIVYVGGILLTLSMGCSPDHPRAAPVEPEKARAALRTTLDAWKAGQSPDSLAQATPPIIAQDIDWLSGYRLTAYTVLGEGTPMDANLHIQAQLTLRFPQGGVTTKTVTYVVGTDPKVTVFRAME